MKLSGWGRYPAVDCKIVTPQRVKDVAELLPDGSVIARGMGRSYGDSALNSNTTVDMRQLNRLLSFDETSGQLVAETGVVLEDIINVFLLRGFFPPVTPGTKFVTLGGMIAADVHGKNHHKVGSFGNFVDWIDLLGPDNQIRRCSREENEDLFAHTIGGMGLTGIILRAAVRLKPVSSCWIKQKTVAYDNLDDLLAGLEGAEEEEYSVAWVDCLARGDKLGRSLLYIGKHAEVDELGSDIKATPLSPPKRRRFTVPMELPSFTLNKLSVGLFNRLYYQRGLSAARQANDQWALVDYDSYFYPLDSILHWNRIYGRAGLLQFQTVLPLETAKVGLSELLSETSRAGQGSFLSVLKKFGTQAPMTSSLSIPLSFPLSFPMAGYTLTLDFPVTERTKKLVDELTQIAISHGGRFYLAKDATLTETAYHQSDKRGAAMAAYRQEMGLSQRFQSQQSQRVGL